jgi:hypothetical protein
LVSAGFAGSPGYATSSSDRSALRNRGCRNHCPGPRRPSALGRDAGVGGSGIERIVDQFRDKVDDVVDGTVDQNVVTEVDVECKSPWWKREMNGCLMLERRATPSSTSSSSPSTCSSRQPLLPPPHPVQPGHSRTVGRRSVYIEK